ncbi:MAG: TonB-dependent receptor [Flavobacteriales bacterium]|nr:TonB-dependent receptor [Flavobacteriales bacterium]MCB9192267.1 TonB-dependent receptor [Flavobacteriales bacterium]
MKHIGACLFLVLHLAVCRAQVSDSVSYPEVTVTAQRISEAIGSSVTESDSITLTIFRARGLRQVLELEGFISTRSYSPGGVANFSIRGSGSQHTQVVWEGIPINDPMLGQSDLSAISLGGVSNVRVLYGAAGLTNNSGGIGGTIELQSMSERAKDGLDLRLQTYAGSFGTYGLQLQLRDRYKRVFGSTSVEYHTAKNNFKFTNIGSVAREEKEMTHAQVERIGFTRSVGYMVNDKNKVKLSLYYSQAERELPPTMLTASTKEELFDRDIWGVLSWTRHGKKSRLSVSGSYIYGKQEYFDNNEYTFHHLYQANKNLVRYKLNLPYNLYLELGGDIFNEHVRSDSAYRNTPHWRYWQAAFASLKYVPKKWVSAQVLVREDVIDGKFSPVQGLVGIEIKPTSWLKFKGNAARNFRAPTMNDLYWIPGGNQNLKNESGFSWEAGFDIARQWKKFGIQLGSVFYRSEIENWIIWLPLDGIWTPQNKRAVTTRGVESELDLSMKIGKVLLRFNAAHTWVSSTVSKGASANDASVGKQLIYVPTQQARGQLSVHTAGLMVLFGHQFIGERFTTSDNGSALPAYQLSYASFGYEHRFSKHRLGINCTIENLFNTTYQTIAWRPMPGRSFLINLNYQFL